MDAKGVYQRKIKGQLTRWKTKIETLKVQVEKAGAEAKAKYEEYLPTLQAKREAAERKLEELKTAGEGTWENLKAGVEFAWSELSVATEHAVARFRQGASPANREEEIRLIAYGIWDAEGRPEGRDREHWLRAEAIWQERQSQQQARSAIRPGRPAKKKRPGANPDGGKGPTA